MDYRKNIFKVIYKKKKIKLDEKYFNFKLSMPIYYGIAFDFQHPKPEDELTRWCRQEGLAIIPHMLIGEANY